jgi:ribosomal protein S18 acetylase RimI-like enzyme
MTTIRPARPSDEERLGRFGGALMRQHHAADPLRFIQVENPELGYGRFLVSQISNRDSIVLVAESEGAVIGYVYATVEGTSWMELRGPSGVIQDVYVDEPARGAGAGGALVSAAVEWIRTKGRTQAVLMTKTRNEHAQRLFASAGFRPTMIEMTLDLEASETIGHG